MGKSHREFLSGSSSQMWTEITCLLDSKFRVWLSHNKATVAACTVRPLKSIQSKQNVTGCSDAEFESARESVLTCSIVDGDKLIQNLRMKEISRVWSWLPGCEKTMLACKGQIPIQSMSESSVEMVLTQQSTRRQWKGDMWKLNLAQVWCSTLDLHGDAPEATGHNWRNEK